MAEKAWCPFAKACNPCSSCYQVQRESVRKESVSASEALTLTEPGADFSSTVPTIGDVRSANDWECAA